MMNSGPGARGPLRGAAGSLPLRPPHPPHLRRRVQGRILLRVFSVARLSRAGLGIGRQADLQELRSMWKASERTYRSLPSEGNEASTSSHLPLYILARITPRP